MKKVTLGGDRLGSGKKQEIELHGYERSTHNLGYIWRSTMAAGTLVPFLCELGLPGDTFDINLNCDIKTHPTIGPLFGSYKVQLDIFEAPIRLYQGQLHNNKLGVGMKMANVKLPQMTLYATHVPTESGIDYDNAQINPSSILSYLNIRGVGQIDDGDTNRNRDFNAIPLLAYWEIYKNYYANKQEEIGVVIHTERRALVDSITEIEMNSTIPQAPTTGAEYVQTGNTGITINYTVDIPISGQIIFNLQRQGFKSLNEIANQISVGGGLSIWEYKLAELGTDTIRNWDYIKPTQIESMPVSLQSFDLDQIDKMREAILGAADNTAVFNINDQTLDPYQLILNLTADGLTNYLSTQEGLAVKTYQSDLFNNWLNTEWIDGVDGITGITSVDTSSGEFTIDALNLAKKVYDMLNRIAVSGGTYDDWLDVTYDHDRITRAESPIYHGGLIKELVFQEVVSNSESSAEGQPSQPLGTLAGKGTMAHKHKGGNITVKVNEPSYIIGIISLTPRIDYSQGNKWDTQLKTMDDFHKPALDEIGFQELIEEQMAWWTTHRDFTTHVWETKSAGKQPAWINYMTNVNQVRGNFAIRDNEMFMTLNRRYTFEDTDIRDLTTYIDPAKFNNIFAQTSLDAQNFWTQIAVDMTARRKMSAKIMPNL